MKAFAVSAAKKAAAMRHRERDILLVVEAFIVSGLSCSDGQRDQSGREIADFLRLAVQDKTDCRVTHMQTRFNVQMSTLKHEDETCCIRSLNHDLQKVRVVRFSHQTDGRTIPSCSRGAGAAQQHRSHADTATCWLS